MALVDETYIRNMPLGTSARTLPASENLQQIIETASEYVQRYLDRRIQASNVTERIVGTGRYTLILGEYPVNALLAVEGSGYYSSILSYSPSDFLIHSQSGMIEQINKRQVFRRDLVYTVTYNAGYATIPADIKHATALQAIELLQPMYGGFGSEGMVPETSAQIIELLEPHRRKRVS